jgi:expansin (peptidoglycan-binding protein)
MLAILIVTQSMSPAACASGTSRAAALRAVRPPAAAVHAAAAVQAAAVHAAAAKSGTATWYTLAGLPNCSFPSQPDYFVALGPAEYDAAGACGGYLDLTGPDGSVRVKVVDQCPECDAGELDLSKAAFAKLADPQRGKVTITYRRVVDPAVGSLRVRVKEGSSQWWLALLVDNHGNPLTKVQVRSGSGSWSTMTHVDYNYWIKEDGAGTGPFQVRVTDDRGHVAVVKGVDLSPGTMQKSSVSIYGGSGTGSGEAPATTTASTAKTRTTKPARSTTTSAGVTATTTPTPTATSEHSATDVVAAGATTGAAPTSDHADSGSGC